MHAATGEDRWHQDYAAEIGADRAVTNRSGVAIKALYTPRDWSGEEHRDDVGYPGQPPYTRGIYATMHRGRTWTQRQLIGLSTPSDYNARLLGIIAQGRPRCRSFRATRCSAATTWTRWTRNSSAPAAWSSTPSTTWTTCLAGVDIGRMSCAMNDPSPFTLQAFLLATAKRRGVAWDRIRGTSNQSDYLSHYVANHMFFRLALPAARRVLLDHIEFCNRHVPLWNPMSVVGQHMQQAGATPAEAMAFTFATALQTADDCIARGMAPDDFLPRFTFFFDISLSFFEEIARFRAGRRIWERLTRERYGVKNPRSSRFKFHAQTSGVDLTRAQPHNNIARVTVQAMAGIFGGLQSLHTDAYDEALSCPTEFGARIAVATQNILREEAHLTDVIDPLGGSYYVETLTNEMEAAILRLDATGRRRRRHVRSGRGRRRAAADRRIGAEIPGEHRVGRADGGRGQRVPYRRGPQRAAFAAEARPANDAGACRGVQGVQGGAFAGGRRQRAGRARAGRE